MGWHEDYPEWSRAVHALARELAELDGKDPDAETSDRYVLPQGVIFTETDARLTEAIEVFGGPKELVVDRYERAVRIADWRERRRSENWHSSASGV